MKQLSEAQLDQRIDTFLSRKMAQHPDMRRTDGVKAGKVWHIDGMAKRTWRLLDGHRLGESNC